MPSPLAHLAAGAAVASVCTRNVGDPFSRRWIWGSSLFFSLAPDMDAIPGFLAGNMALYHNQITHSLFFGVVACLLTSGVFWLFFRRFLDWWSYRRIASLALVSYGLHLVMDAATHGPGVKLLWPFTDERFSAPVAIFYGVRHSDGLFSLHHLITIGTELAIIAGFLLLAHFRFRLLRRVLEPISLKS
ncbi:metal-dependent hydrolase [Desulfonatronum lacustre]|uniref:metal-dependent hydrolase n=1 Tax=Desulfonatronum lacustre TaxID=66849 RepID=UPI000490526F|nr:metal-dependent hydrolase [Desulfonatronum lacustre]